MHEAAVGTATLRARMKAVPSREADRPVLHAKLGSAMTKCMHRPRYDCHTNFLTKE
jgi:hypothetical protein